MQDSNKQYQYQNSVPSSSTPDTTTDMSLQSTHFPNQSSTQQVHGQTQQQNSHDVQPQKTVLTNDQLNVFNMQDNYFNQLFQSPLPTIKIDQGITLCGNSSSNLMHGTNLNIQCDNSVTQIQEAVQVHSFGGEYFITNSTIFKDYESNTTLAHISSAQVIDKEYSHSNKMESLNTALNSDDGGTGTSRQIEQLSTGNLTAKSSGAGLSPLDYDDNNSMKNQLQQNTDEDTKATSEEDSPQPQRSSNFFKKDSGVKDDQQNLNSNQQMQNQITTITDTQAVQDSTPSNQVIDEEKKESQEYDQLIKITQCKTGKVSKEDFSLISVIGTGSYGKVLLVKKKSNGNLYAMKILKKKQLRKQKQVKNTWTERKILEKIDHPFIVKMNCAFQTEKKLFFVLDYCPGGELFFYISQIGRFKETSAKFYAANILLALECLHENGIIYRDLKPENILIDKDGFAKLTDFGLSKDNIMGDQLVNSFCGTAEYLAPEVLNKQGYSYPCDWWSFGCVVYEMLSAIPPFYSKKRFEIYDKIKFKNPNFYHYHSDLAVDLISKLLDKDPSKRLGSQRGAQEIKDHPFFADVDWEKMMKKQLSTPYKPILDGKDDTKHFDQDICNIPIESPIEDSFGQVSDAQSSNQHDDFDGFSFVAETLSPYHQINNNSGNLSLKFNLNITASD